jgi:hypothetical protein
VGRDLADRGYRAVEALGDRSWDGSWVLPASFLGANGVHGAAGGSSVPLMRLDLRAALDPDRSAAAGAEAEEELPEPAVTLPMPARRGA